MDLDYAEVRPDVKHLFYRAVVTLHGIVRAAVRSVHLLCKYINMSLRVLIATSLLPSVHIVNSK